MASERLQEEWNSLEERLKLTSECSKEIYSALISAYTSPKRRYHTLEHISSMLQLYKEYKKLADDPDWLELSIWFHDAVYEPAAPDNEEKSAGLAKLLLKEACLSDKALSIIEEQILSTKHDKEAVCYDSKLISDLDFASLALPYEKFTANTGKIWYELEEYYTPEKFMQANGNFYKSMLARKAIFQTPLLRERYEAAARSNIMRALSELE